MYDTLRLHAHHPRRDRARSAARPCADVGGLSDDTLAEDTDLTMAIHRAGWRVVYEETARAWTEAPATLRAAVAAALPVELRHHAGDVEAPRGGRSTRGPSGPLRPARAAVHRPVQGRAAAARAAARHHGRLRHVLPRPTETAVGLAARCWPCRRDRRGARLPPRPGAAASPVDAAAAAVGLPPGDVPGPAAVRRSPRSPARRLRWQKLRRTGEAGVVPAPSA